MKDLTQALRDLVQLFERMETPYVVMGGIAVRVYGIPRATQGKLDEDYMRHWARQLGVEAELERVLAQP